MVGVGIRSVGASAFAVAFAALAIGGARAAAEEVERELPAERELLVQAAVSGGYAELPGGAHAGRLRVSARGLLGRPLGYCAGVDAELGASAEGAVYGAELFFAGAGARLGDAGMIALCGGVGGGGARGAIPAALQVPIELRARAQLGPVRVGGWAIARLTPLDDARRAGTDLPGIDELEAAVAVGLGRQRSYWERASAGAGPYLALTYRELLGERVLGVALGIELLGAE